MTLCLSCRKVECNGIWEVCAKCYKSGTGIDQATLKVKFSNDPNFKNPYLVKNILGESDINDDKVEAKSKRKWYPKKNALEKVLEEKRPKSAAAISGSHGGK